MNAEFASSSDPIIARSYLLDELQETFNNNTAHTALVAPSEGQPALLLRGEAELSFASGPRICPVQVICCYNNGQEFKVSYLGATHTRNVNEGPDKLSSTTAGLDSTLRFVLSRLHCDDDALQFATPVGEVGDRLVAGYHEYREKLRLFETYYSQRERWRNRLTLDGLTAYLRDQRRPT